LTPYPAVDRTTEPNMHPDSRHIHELTSPLDHALPQGELGTHGRLQTCRALLSEECQRLDDFLLHQPDAQLRVYPPEGTTSIDLGFLRELPALRNLWLEANAGELIDLAVLAGLTDRLRTFTLDTLAPGSDPKRDRPKRSTEVLESLQALETLSVCGRLQDLRFLGQLHALETLSLWRSTLGSLAGLESCARMRKLELRATGVKALDQIEALADLAFLDVWDLRKLASLDPIARLPRLRQLRLVGCKVDQGIPSLHGLVDLKVLVIDKLPSVSDLAAIAAAPALRCLVLGGDAAFDVEGLAALAGHACLQEVRLDTFDERLWSEIGSRYGWKVGYCNYPADEYLQ